MCNGEGTLEEEVGDGRERLCSGIGHWAWGVVGVRGERVGEGRRCQRERRGEACRSAGDGCPHTTRWT